MTRVMVMASAALAACSAEAPGLITQQQITGDAIEAALTLDPGDATRGRLVFEARDRGHCVLCHAVAGLEAEFQGNVGPDLSTVGDRLSAGQLRLRIVDYQIIRPGAVMPSYFRNHNLHQVGSEYEGTTILSAQDIEDLVVYLSERKASDDDA